MYEIMTFKFAGFNAKPSVETVTMCVGSYSLSPISDSIELGDHGESVERYRFFGDAMLARKTALEEGRVNYIGSGVYSALGRSGSIFLRSREERILHLEPLSGEDILFKYSDNKMIIGMAPAGASIDDDLTDVAIKEYENNERFRLNKITFALGVYAIFVFGTLVIFDGVDSTATNFTVAEIQGGSYGDTIGTVYDGCYT